MKCVLSLAGCLPAVTVSSQSGISSTTQSTPLPTTPANPSESFVLPVILAGTYTLSYVHQPCCSIRPFIATTVLVVILTAVLLLPVLVLYITRKCKYRGKISNK